MSTVQSSIDNRFSKTNLYIAGIFTTVYLGLQMAFDDLRGDHLQFIGLLLLLFFVSTPTRKWVLGFGFFWVFWMIYDAMRLYPNYLVNEVNIADPYNFDKTYFGVYVDGIKVTLNEYWLLNQSKVLDFITGIFYLTWVTAPLAFGFYLFFKDREVLIRFFASYLFANLFGFLIYYSYPAAPPWYYMLHGDVLDFTVPSNPAELVRFDAIIDHPLFSNMYTKNSNVFAAIPSLHSAYPVVTLIYALMKKYYKISVLIFIDCLGIWFSAVYSNHHYLIDVLLGILCALIAVLLFEKLVMKTPFKSFLKRYAAYIK